MQNTTWRKEIIEEMKLNGEDWGDTVSVTLTETQLDTEFYAGFGTEEGVPFTLWTKRRVYFPRCYDGSESCASVSRKPNGKPTDHIGG